MTTWLSAHFALEELSRTSHREIDNDPPPDVVAALRHTAIKMERVRTLLGNKAISVSSGYRSPRLNRLVGGDRRAHV